MKVKIDISCTPQEARTFLGLPDVEGMNAALTEEMTRKMQESITNATPEALMGQWMSASGKIGEQFMGLMSKAVMDAGAKKR